MKGQAKKVVMMAVISLVAVAAANRIPKIRQLIHGS